jgi:thiol-disulfide isomerase/thioredoxin
MKALITGAALAAILGFVVCAAPPADALEDSEPAIDNLWYPASGDGATPVALYFVYSETCPHCAAAKPFVEYLQSTYDWLAVEWVSTQAATEEQIDTVLRLSSSLEEEIVAVPTFLFCERMEIGYDSADTTGENLERALVACHDALASPEATQSPSQQDNGLHLPVLGDIDAEAVSLPVFTVAVAGLDAFNPCAFFVLLFLLSLLVHARSRWRMALVGGVFVVISGVMYFAFMAAWLNVFLVTGQLRWVTAVAGAIAITLAALNIKDYFFPGTSASASIPDSAKPGLFARMRRLTTGDSLPTVLVGTVVLAAVANSYELLCTAGFPLVFTRVLTLNDLPTGSYYGYLTLYNLVYVVPLLAIVGGFVWTLGSHKLSETEGRFLKLMSGAMMLGLGTLLVIKPSSLENMFTGVAILAAAVIAAALVYLLGRRFDKPVPLADSVRSRRGAGRRPSHP